MAATTQEQERYHGCKHAQKRSNDGPEAHQTAIRLGSGIRRTARRKRSEGAPSTLPPQRSPLNAPQHQSLSYPRDTGGRKETHPTKTERACYGFPQIPMRPPRRRWVA